MYTYRKLSVSEIEALLGFRVTNRTARYQSVIDHVKVYYPATAVRAVVQFHSEYNDSTYDLSIAHVAVFDAKGNEILPKRGEEREARSAWKELSLPELNESQRESEAEDVVIPLSGTGLPDLYVKDEE